MRYIKIREKSYNSALMKLRTEYGDEAIPISHKYVKEGGILKSRFFAKDVVELTAAVQDKTKHSRPLAQKRTLDIRDDEVQRSGAANPAVETLNKTINELSANMKHDKKQPALKPVNQANDAANVSDKRDAFMHEPNYAAIHSFEKEFSEIKETLNRLIRERSALESDDVQVKEKIADDNMFRPFVDVLKNNDYDHEQCKLIINEIKSTVSSEELKDKYRIEKSLKDLLKSRIVTTGAIKKGNKKKVVMFFGPTGVGKTTTMAKLGAMFSLREGKRVEFVTIDTYRIAATEQLKKYAEIMRIPLKVTADQKEFSSVIRESDAEIIFVDTSGRSHRNDLKISEIKSFADQIETDFEKILCVSANTKKNDLTEILKSFTTIEYDSIIVTKIDETSFLGNVVDVAGNYKKPISYLTNGQEVPNDIMVADPDAIVDMMVGNISHK